MHVFRYACPASCVFPLPTSLLSTIYLFARAMLDCALYAGLLERNAVLAAAWSLGSRPRRQWIGQPSKEYQGGTSGIQMRKRIGSRRVRGARRAALVLSPG